MRRGLSVVGCGLVAGAVLMAAVVGCGNATMQLQTGDQVRVNGGRGTVELLHKAEPVFRTLKTTNQRQ